MTARSVEETVHVGDRALRLLRPERPEELLDEREFERDEFLPYWAELWPSARALAEVVALRDLRGKRVVEVGCGLGLPALVAAARGAEVLATDWSSDAVAGAAANAARNGVVLATAVWRWTDDPATLGPPFDLVLGADLLYERRNCPWLLEALAGLLAPSGEAWLADPGRATGREFFEGAADVFALERLAHGGAPSVTVHRLARA